jgi:tungstate transport system ATP-binding protein
MVVSNADITVSSAGVTGLIGANGSGKTSLVLMLAGLAVPDYGVVSLTDHAGRAASRKQVGLMMQKPVIMRRSVYRNCEYVLSALNVPFSERADRIMAGLALMKLEHYAQQDARTLSSGEQQRMALARVLMASPGVLLCDEATSNLDPKSTQMIEAVIMDKAAAGMPVLWVTHNLAQLRRMARKVVFMQKGEILANQDIDDFFHTPACSDAAEYLTYERI